MTQQLALEESSFETRAVSPFREMGAYEALWCRHDTTFASLAKRFAEQPGSLPSDFVSAEEAHECATFVTKRFEQAKINKFGVRVHGAGSIPVN